MMSIKRILTAVITASALLSLSLAWAGTATTNMSVSSSVTASCSISSASMSFGSYDPLSANSGSGSNLDQTGSVNVACTSGASANITLGEGSNPTGTSSAAAPERQMDDGASHFLGYFLFQDAGHTTAWGDTAGTGKSHTGTGSAATLSIFGSIPKGQNVPPGNFSDTVLATITF